MMSTESLTSKCGKHLFRTMAVCSQISRSRFTVETQPAGKMVNTKTSPTPICTIFLYVRKFALNVGLEFKTPENLFLGDEKKITVSGFNPANIPQAGSLFANSADSDVKYV